MTESPRLGRIKVLSVIIKNTRAPRSERLIYGLPSHLLLHLLSANELCDKL